MFRFIYNLFFPKKEENIETKFHYITLYTSLTKEEIEKRSKERIWGFRHG